MSDKPRIFALIQNHFPYKHVADGVVFASDMVAVEWFDVIDIQTYNSITEMKYTNRMAVAVLFFDEEARRGAENCIQDGCENNPFGGIGGLEARDNPIAKHCHVPSFQAEYVRGYIEQAEREYGSDWRTCSFSWKPVGVIG